MRVRSVVGGAAAPFTVVAVASAVFGVLVLLLAMQLPTHLYLTGRATAGVNDGGIIYYEVSGEEYTIDAAGPAPAHPEHVTVFVDRGDPYNAVADRPARWLDLGFVTSPFALALVLLVWGQVHRIRRSRRQQELVPLSWFLQQRGSRDVPHDHA